MRRNIVHPGASELQYEIRAIVEVADRLEAAGVPILWENIGDPVAKGEPVPAWLKALLSVTMIKDTSYAYSPTKGLLETRQYLADKRSRETGRQLQADDIIFFNGLGDAISKAYAWLRPRARILGPTPAYPTHSSVEAAHAGDQPLTYQLDPNNGWLPNMADVRNKVKYNPSIVGLLIINPDNPTGMVYPRHILEEFVSIAREYDLFLVADEIYANLVFPDVEFVSIASLCGEIPTIIMRGLSKELPWPGARCGWMEVYNHYVDMDFAKYIQSIVDAKMQEVCATTLPQYILPKALSHRSYKRSIAKRVKKYQRRARQLSALVADMPGVNFVEPKGAFYGTFVIERSVAARKFDMYNDQAQKILDECIMDEPDMPRDKKFCLRVLASTGLCLVPLCGFSSDLVGFRMTLLEEDDAVFDRICGILKEVMS